MICKQCGAEHSRKSEYCSGKCYQQAYYSSPVRNMGIRAAHKARRSTPEGKAYMKARQGTPEYKAYMKVYESRPERQAAKRVSHATPEYKAYMEARQGTPEYKAYMKSRNQSYWRTYYATPEGRARKLASVSRRRAMLRGLECERIDSRSVYARDGWKCGICGKKIDPGLKSPHRKSASLDHIVPISAGGSHTYANVQCAHLGCNEVKGNRYQPTQMRMFGLVFD